jgi:hypothetical protein
MKNDDLLLDKLRGQGTVPPPNQVAPVVPPVEPISPPVEEKPADAPIPPVEPPIDTPPVNPLDVYNQRVKETFGYETLEDFFNGDAVVKLKEHDTVKGRLAEIEAENQMLYGEYSKTTNPFVSETLYKVNHLLAENKGLDEATAFTLVTNDVKALSPLSALLLSKKIADPDIPESAHKTLLAKEFGADNWDALIEDYNTEENTKTYVDAKAAKARKELAKFDVSDIKLPESGLVPEKVREVLSARELASKEAHEKIEATWQPAISSFETNVNEIPIYIPNEKGELVEYSKLVLKPEDKKRYVEAVKAYVKQQGIAERNEQTNAMVNGYLDMVIRLDQQAKMVKFAVDKAVSDTKLALEKERFNPDGDGNDKKGGNEKPVGNAGKRSLDQIISSQTQTFAHQHLKR